MDVPVGWADLLKRYGLAVALAVAALLIRRTLPIPQSTAIYQLAIAAVGSR